MYNPEHQKHSRENHEVFKNVTLHHEFPKDERYQHHAGTWCECIPEVDPDDVSRVIHNRLSDEEVKKNARRY